MDDHPASLAAPDGGPQAQHLAELAAALERLELRTAGAIAETVRRRAAAGIAEYLVPRAMAPDDPISIVVAGPGGSGKSTIVNSLARRRIAEAGPVRPTTQEPLVWCGGPLPATLDALRHRTSGWIVDSHRPPPDGIVLVDSPPPGVTDADGESVAHQLIEVADAMLFVASGARYGDAEAIGLLHRAAQRGIPTVLVLNRLPLDPETQQMIAQDFVSKLAIRRLVARPDVELVTTVSEGEISDDTGGLQPEAVARVRKEIESMSDPQARPDVVRSAVHGSLRRLRADLARVRGAVIDAEVERVKMIDPLRSAFRDQGLLLVGEVRAGKFASEEPRRVLDALASAAARRAGLAALATAEIWEQLSPGVASLTPELYGHGADTVVAARERLAFWETEIRPLIDRIAVRRLRGRRRSALVAHVKRAAVDPKARPSRTASRALRRAPGAVAAARDLLGEELMGILDADSRRFEGRIGQAAPVGILSELADVW